VGVRAIVTGGAGFIGSHVVDALVALRTEFRAQFERRFGFGGVLAIPAYK
jgi:uncharacterized protein YbjT (DUF2867 family)